MISSKTKLRTMGLLAIACVVAASHSVAEMVFDQAQSNDRVGQEFLLVSDAIDSSATTVFEPGTLTDLASQGQEVLERAGLVEPLEWYSPAACGGTCNSNADCDPGCQCQAYANTSDVGVCK